MPSDILFEAKLSSKYKALSQNLKAAADFASANPVDVATRSLRMISSDSGLSPATFSRMARALGYDSYDDLRDVARAFVRESVAKFSSKANLLQQEQNAKVCQPFLTRQSEACAANIKALEDVIDMAALERTVDQMHAANNVLLLGLLGSAGIIEYMGYITNFFSNKYRIANSPGSSIGGALADFASGDAIFIVTKPPFARQSIHAAEIARTRGAFVTVVTDTNECPALQYAHAGLVISSQSPQFFSSYAATIVLIETLVGMLVARAGPEAQHRISQVETRNLRLEETWSL